MALDIMRRWLAAFVHEYQSATTLVVFNVYASSLYSLLFGQPNRSNET